MNEYRAAEQLFALLDDKGKPVQLDEQGQMQESVPEDMISLREWASRNGISPATARQKALRGRLVTARKIGRDWMISASEVNTDHRMRLEAAQEPLLEGPVWVKQVMNYLLSLRGSNLPEKWARDNSHQEYCREIYAKLRGQLLGNSRVIFDLICETMRAQPQEMVCYIPHQTIMEHMDDEAWYTSSSNSTLNAGMTINFQDYLTLLRNTVEDLVKASIELKVHHGAQSLIMPWYHSISWQEERGDGLYFVPSDFFRVVISGIFGDLRQDSQ